MATLNPATVVDALRAAKKGLEMSQTIQENAQLAKKRDPSIGERGAFIEGVARTAVDAVYDVANGVVGGIAIGPAHVLAQAVDEVASVVFTDEPPPSDMSGKPSTQKVVVDVIHFAAKPVDVAAQVLGTNRDESCKQFAPVVEKCMDQADRVVAHVEAFGEEGRDVVVRQGDRCEKETRAFADRVARGADAVGQAAKSLAKGAVDNERRQAETHEKNVRDFCHRVEEVLGSGGPRSNGQQDERSYRMDLPFDPVIIDDNPLLGLKEKAPVAEEKTPVPLPKQKKVESPHSSHTGQHEDSPIKASQSAQQKKQAVPPHIEAQKQERKLKFQLDETRAQASIKAYAEQFAPLPSWTDRVQLQVVPNGLQVTIDMSGKGQDSAHLQASDIERWVHETAVSGGGMSSVKDALQRYNAIQINTYFCLRSVNRYGIVRQANSRLNGHRDMPKLQAITLSDGSTVLVWKHHRHKDWSMEIASCDPRLSQFVKDQNMAIITRSEQETEAKAKDYFEGLLSRFDLQKETRKAVDLFTAKNYEQAEPKLVEIAKKDPSNQKVREALAFLEARKVFCAQAKEEETLETTERVPSEQKDEVVEEKKAAQRQEDRRTSLPTPSKEKADCADKAPTNESKRRVSLLESQRSFDLSSLRGVSIDLSSSRLTRKEATHLNGENLLHMMCTGMPVRPGFFHTDSQGHVSFRVNTQLAVYGPLAQHVGQNFELYLNLAATAGRKVCETAAYVVAKTMAAGVRGIGVVGRWIYDAFSDTEWNHDKKVLHHKSALHAMARALKDAIGIEQDQEEGPVRRCLSFKRYMSETLQPGLIQIEEHINRKRQFIHDVEVLFQNERAIQERQEQRTSLYRVASTKSLANGSVTYQVACALEAKRLFTKIDQEQAEILRLFRQLVTQGEQECLAEELPHIEPLLRRRLQDGAFEAASRSLRGGITSSEEAPEEFDGLFFVYVEEFMRHVREEALDVIRHSTQMTELFDEAERRFRVYQASEEAIRLFDVDESNMGFFRSLFHTGRDRLVEAKKVAKQTLTESLKGLCLCLTHRSLFHISSGDPLEQEKLLCRHILSNEQVEAPPSRRRVATSLLSGISRLPLYENESAWFRAGVPQRKIMGGAQDEHALAARLIDLGWKDVAYTPTSVDPILLEGVRYRRYTERGDGNCCYRAVSSHLMLAREQNEQLNTYETATVTAKKPHAMLRRQCAAWIRTYQDHANFQATLADGIAEFVEVQRAFLRRAEAGGEERRRVEELVRFFETHVGQFHESVERYCQEIEREGVWADRTVLIALSHMMQRPIVIHHAIDGQDRSERIGSQYRVKATCHCFFTGNHYDFLAQAEGNREPAPERRMNDRDMGVYLEELYVPDDSADTFDYVIEHPMPR